jgi:DNA-binding XRE family transcriptional regulator
MTGQELRRARKRLKMTQNQLAAAIDYAKNSIARMERGELGIAKVTELAIKYLLVAESKKRRKR